MKWTFFRGICVFNAGVALFGLIPEIALEPTRKLVFYAGVAATLLAVSLWPELLTTEG